MSNPTPEKTSKDDLPPSRPKEDRGVRTDVRPPFARVSFSTFLHGLTAMLLAVFCWYAYSAATMALGFSKGSSPPSSGGILWMLGLGRSGPNAKSGKPESGHEEHGNMGVERRIEELAKALGMPDSELAVAIAGVVKEHVPPASLSSLAAQAKETGGSKIVDVLVRQNQDREGQGAKGVAGTFGGMVGDEVPGAELD
ncbi:hypothetical protein OF83DRAFT_1099642 [Amylostereum chailletii]|nr:hypothetical protein OF83DRAFT_1099642 [Amylostereum chailletii]